MSETFTYDLQLSQATDTNAVRKLENMEETLRISTFSGH